jgi:two-component system, OmpR family, sensor histidine kinase SenX3
VKKAPPSSAVRRLPVFVTAVLLALLGLLATLQWQWIGELSAAERRRMLVGIESAVDRFADDFDREIARAAITFHPDLGRPAPEGWLSERWAHWQEEAPYPRLVRGLVRVGEGQTPACFAPASQAFEPCEAALLAGLDRALEHAAVRERGEPSHPMPALLPEIPALVLPLGAAGGGFAADARLVVVLDRSVLASVLLPDLADRHFAGGRDGDYTVAVAEPGPPPELLYASDSGLALATLSAPDAVRPLPSLRPFAEMPPRWHDDRPRERHAPWVHDTSWEHRRRRGEAGEPGISAVRFAGARGPWILAVKRRAGTVDQAVGRFRSHNLLISVFVLGLIAVTAVVMTTSAQRAQRLARQRIEFVAGVTHELHTPLTAICTAGENLADGVVAEPEQVRRYGAMIEREGRRLADMVAQVLETAGIESGRRVDRRESVTAEEVVAAALASSRWLVEEAGVRVEREIESGLPPLYADGAALGRAVRNLIENAVKYGGAQGWLAVRARHDGTGVAIEVADRGPGVSGDEMQRIFEPFYRGSAAAGAPGSGLGLSLVRQIVEAHGGTVSVATGPDGRGAVFTLHLPGAEAA